MRGAPLVLGAIALLCALKADQRAATDQVATDGLSAFNALIAVGEDDEAIRKPLRYNLDCEAYRVEMYANPVLGEIVK